MDDVPLSERPAGYLGTGTTDSVIVPAHAPAPAAFLPSASLEDIVQAAAVPRFSADISNAFLHAPTPELGEYVPD
jgi:hypothetical protein